MNNKVKMLVGCLIIVFVSMPVINAVQWDIFDADKMFYIFGDNSSAIPVLNFVNENFSTYMFSNGTGLYYLQNGIMYNLTNGTASGPAGGDCYWINKTSSLVYNGADNIRFNRYGDAEMYIKSETGVAILNLDSIDRPTYRLSMIDFNNLSSMYNFDSDTDSQDSFRIQAEPTASYGLDFFYKINRTIINAGGSNSFRFNKTGFEYPFRASGYNDAELEILDVRYSNPYVAIFSDYKDLSWVVIRQYGANGTTLEGTDGGVPAYHLESSINGHHFFITPVNFHGFVRMTDNLTVEGKINAVGGVDPPYVSYDKMTFDGIKKMSLDCKQDNVMQFWSSEYNRMMIYDIEQDKFFDLMGVEYI